MCEGARGPSWQRSPRAFLSLFQDLSLRHGDVGYRSPAQGGCFLTAGEEVPAKHSLTGAHEVPPSHW